ncbi:MAG: hypothetical protein KGL39_40310 [Patescibacteria group bacterium]|nr:hypothetical protein [Patescibacteria group bacterium]
MSDLQMILERVAPGRDASCFKMWACRGEGRGCTRNKYRNQKKHCDDCVEAREKETLGELQERLSRGDA